MNKEEINLLKIQLILDYYKNNNITEHYKNLIENRIVFDNDTLDILNDINENIYITKFNKYNELKQQNKKYKEENEFLKSEIEEAKRIFQKYLEYIDERDEKINKAIKYLEYNNETLYTYEPDYDYEENMVDNYDISNYREDLLKILKEVE